MSCVTFPAMKRRIPQIPRMCFTDSTDSTYSCTPRPALPRQTRCSRFCGLSCLLRVLKRPVQALVSKTFVFAAAAGCSLKSGNRKLVDGCCCTYQTPLFEFSDSSRQNIHRLKHSRRKQYSRMPQPTHRPSKDSGRMPCSAGGGALMTLNVSARINRPLSVLSTLPRAFFCSLVCVLLDRKVHR